MAMNDGKQSLRFLDKEVTLDPKTGVFVTMNPAGGLYGGRSKLPENLKQLFRSVCMTQPDQQHIAQVLLATEGFTKSRELSQKLTKFFTLCKECLSSRRYYDWGLRALKSVLEKAGKTRREMQDLTEDHCIVISLQGLKLPCLSVQDEVIFKELLNNVFSPIQDDSFESIEGLIKAAAQELGLEIDKEQISKTVYLKMALEQRMGVILMGPPLSGKSTLWKLLQKSNRLKNE